MKALADENFPRAAVQELRRRGWDIVVVQEWRAATDDGGVAAKAREEGRVLLTFDKDFGQLWKTTQPLPPAESSSSGSRASRRPKRSNGSSAR